MESSDLLLCLDGSVHYFVNSQLSAPLSQLYTKQIVLHVFSVIMFCQFPPGHQAETF
jgi:hypothetical protein